MAAPQRRCRDPLGPRAHEERYAATSQHADCYLSGCKALRERTGQECLAAHLNAKTAAAASHAPLYTLEPTESVAADMNTWGEGMAESRRGAIRYLFEAALGAPSEDEWDGPTGAVKEICDRLSIPKGSRPLVKKVLKDILKAQKDGYYYKDPRRFNCGTPKELSHSLLRVWEVSPTPARILEDCGAIRQRLERIVAEKGVAIQDIYFRTGRRYISASGGRVLKSKPRKRQRKATNELPEVHPDAREAFESFQGSLSVDADT